jgi:hypothetical protein
MANATSVLGTVMPYAFNNQSQDILVLFRFSLSVWFKKIPVTDR